MTDMSEWKSFKRVFPAIGSKFVALYSDGSGAVMLWRHDAGFLDLDGYEWHGSEIDDVFDLWMTLPDSKQFFCETRGEDLMTLSVSSQDRSEA
jgi:hypothetical protein